MVVDFHTHTFPDKIAAQSIAFLSEKGGIRAYRAGTLAALKDSMRQNGVDYSVVLPVATKPQQEKSINALSKTENGRDGVFFAGGIHPDREHVHCTPDMILRVLSELGSVLENKLILAHLGGFDLPDEVLQKLCGKPVYMDTAAVLHLYPDKCREIIRRHGPERILFATDSPWADQRSFLDRFHSFGFSQSDEARMLYQNAERLLGVWLL